MSDLSVSNAGTPGVTAGSRIDWKDIWSSVLGLFVLVHTIYPEATGAAIVNAFQDGSWVGYAIDLMFAHALIRQRGSNP